MNFSLSETQVMMRSEARKFLEKDCPVRLVRELEGDEKGYSPELWRKMGELGWMALPFPEVHGGLGGSFLDLVLLIEETGRVCLPSPLIPSVILGGMTLLNMGSDLQKSKSLPAIITGETICTLALLESNDNYGPSGVQCHAVPSGNGYLLKGTKRFVPDAHVADQILVAARTLPESDGDSGITLLILDANDEGIQVRPLKTFAGDKPCVVAFDIRVPQSALIGENGKAWACLEKTLEMAAVAKCAEMVGGARRILEMSLAYARERTQFGRPIGSFQAIQHHCANMAMDVEAAGVNTYHAAWLISEGLPATKNVSAAKAFVGEAFRRVGLLGHQIHGAIGFTRELDLELFIRRIKAGEASFGNADFHRQIIAQSIVNEQAGDRRK
ncbi:MAG: acyl-CoA/acyl-ACP dehydrogenase [Deltaproteobacteria bacterium]|nr:acyl-CoA/acyl-ACP dehydrogenase [Deltaproteobacteria bacterium]